MEWDNPNDDLDVDEWQEEDQDEYVPFDGPFEEDIDYQWDQDDETGIWQYHIVQIRPRTPTGPVADSES
jgi:hypothetical protein